ncbi:MAG: ABC transporter ATP-binding protein [Terriglobales bacterium]
MAVERLVVRYGARTVLNELTFALAGRAVGLLGPNGAGKSTLINTLLGFVRPASGRAQLLGRDVATAAQAIRREVGYMPENDAFIADLSAVTFIRMMAELSGLPAAAALERAHETLFYVGLGEARYRKLGTYSQGMKQLAKLAQAIVHGPRLLILDEPTNALDPVGRDRMIALIREIRDQPDMHILLCSHLLRDVEDTCDEVVILRQGQLVHQARLAEEAVTNPRFVELEPQVESPAFEAGLAGLGCEVARAGRRLKLILPAGVGVREVYGLAAAQELALRRVQFRRDTLEDVFMRAMEGDGTRAVEAG